MAKAAAAAKRADRLERDDDPDGDGAPNLLEYASGTGPFDAASVPVVLPRIVEEKGRKLAVLEFRGRRDTETLRYSIEQSRGLNDGSQVKETREISRRPVTGQPLEVIQFAVCHRCHKTRHISCASKSGSVERACPGPATGLVAAQKS